MRFLIEIFSPNEIFLFLGDVVQHSESRVTFTYRKDGEGTIPSIGAVGHNIILCFLIPIGLRDFEVGAETKPTNKW